MRRTEKIAAIIALFRRCAPDARESDLNRYAAAIVDLHSRRLASEMRPKIETTDSAEKLKRDSKELSEVHAAIVNLTDAIGSASSIHDFTKQKADAFLDDLRLEVGVLEKKVADAQANQRTKRGKRPYSIPVDAAGHALIHFKALTGADVLAGKASHGKKQHASRFLAELFKILEIDASPENVIDRLRRN